MATVVETIRYFSATTSLFAAQKRFRSLIKQNNGNWV